MVANDIFLIHSGSTDLPTVTDVDELRAAQLAEREAEYTKEIEALTESVASLETKLADKEFRINRYLPCPGEPLP